MLSSLGLTFLILLHLSETPATPTPPPPISVTLQYDASKTILQGQCGRFILNVENEKPEDTYFLEILDQKIPFFALKKDRQHSSYQTFLAIKADIKPGQYPIKITNQQHHILREDILHIKPGRFYTQALRIRRPKPSPQAQAIVEQEEKLIEQARKLMTPEALWQEPFILPVPQRVSAAFGTRRYLNGNYNGYHSGVDFASPMGYPVKAPAAAQVSLARYFSIYNSNGNTVFLNHGQGVSSVYIHLSKIAVKEHDWVKKGQIIGYIGTTGRSTGPHLHWSLYLNGQNMDGLYWIRFTEALFR